MKPWNQSSKSKMIFYSTDDSVSITNKQQKKSKTIKIKLFNILR